MSGLHDEFEAGDTIPPDAPGAEAWGKVLADARANEAEIPSAYCIERLIREACAEGATHVHLEALADRVRIRFRISGRMRDKLELPRAVRHLLIARIKVMSHLDVAERRLPQNGKLRFGDFDPRYAVELRVQTIPCEHGESVCLTLPDPPERAPALAELGLSAENLARVRRLLERGRGLVLFAGPPRSGRATAMAAAVRETAAAGRVVLTAEDPVRAHLPGAAQCQVVQPHGLTLARLLDAFALQDGDVAVAEGLDEPEAAVRALRLARAGMLVLGGLRAPDAADAVLRVAERAGDPFLAADGLAGVVALRQARRLCGCRTQEEARPEERALLARAGAPESARVFRPAGCDLCAWTGYRGVVGIHEVLALDGGLRDLLVRGPTPDEWRAEVKRKLGRTLYEDAIEKACAGATSLVEAAS